MLLAHPEMFGSIWKLIAVKIVAALISGITADLIVKVFRISTDGESIEDICTESGCGCGSRGIWYSALKHTIGVGVFIFIVNLIIGAVMAFAGKRGGSAFLSAEWEFFSPLPQELWE